MDNPRQASASSLATTERKLREALDDLYEEELKRRAAQVSREYTRRSEQYQRSVIPPPKPEPAKPAAPKEGERKEQSKAGAQKQKQEAAKGPANEEKSKRLRNMALFERAVKDVQKKESGGGNRAKAKRKSIGMEFATAELKEKPPVNRDHPPPIAPPKKKVTQLPFDASREFFENGKLLLSQKLTDGFYDPGSGASLPRGAFPALAELRKRDTAAGEEEEMVVIDRQNDPRLAHLVAEAERFCGFIPDTELRAKMLSLFVSNAMGGSRIDNTHAPVSRLHAEDLRLLIQENKTRVIPIGAYAHGLLRHRALLFKYLADRSDVASELVRSPTAPDLYWNIVELEKKRFVVDVMHKPANLYPLHSLAYYAYTRITPPAGHPSGTPEPAPHAHESLLSYEPRALASATTDIIKGSGGGAGYRWVLPQDLSRAQLVLLNKLGSGGFGAVWRCKLGGFTCAVKIVHTESLSKSSKKRVMQEIELLQKLQHRHIVSFLGKEVKDKELHIFMELVPHSLFEIIQQIKRGERPPFTPDEIITCISHMAKGLMYLHGLPAKVIHRDIKSKNVLIELGGAHEAAIQTAKLCDFGVSKIVTESTQADTSIGTSRWMAPEVVAALDGQREAYDEKSDVWALGMVLFEMLTLQLPYEEVGLFDVRQHILKGHSPAFKVAVCEDYDPFLPLFHNCIKFKPEERYSAEQALLHLLRL